MDRVSAVFSQGLSDGPQNPNDIADVSLLVFHAHVDNAAVIGDPVKQNADLHPSGAELPPDVPGKDDIRAAVVLNLMDLRVKFIDLLHTFLHA